jgi:hypothetical protein
MDVPITLLRVRRTLSDQKTATQRWATLGSSAFIPAENTRRKSGRNSSPLRGNHSSMRNAATLLL